MLNKSIVLATLLAGISIHALADDQSSQKLATVKAMYQQDMRTQQGFPTLKRYADSGLKKAFQVKDRIGNQGEICGPDYDVMWQSQDPNYRSKLQFTALANGQVQVNVGGRTVRYALACSSGKCQITDILDRSGSVKKIILKECR